MIYNNLIYIFLAGIPPRTSSTPQEYEKFLDRYATLHRKTCDYEPKDEVRTCIMPHGSSREWEEKSFGISWIGVQGTGGVFCVLSLRDETRPIRDPVKMPVAYVLEIAMSDIGGASSHSISRRVASWSKSEGPFAVVSVAPDTVEDHQASAAINFLKKELEHCSALTAEKTVEVAILALEYLFGSKVNFKAIQDRCSAELRKLMSRKGGEDRFFKDAYMSVARKEGGTQEDG